MTSTDTIRKFLEEQNKLIDEALMNPPVINYIEPVAFFRFMRTSAKTHQKLCKMVEIMSEAMEPYGGPLKEALQKCAEIVSGK